MNHENDTRPGAVSGVLVTRDGCEKLVTGLMEKMAHLSHLLRPQQRLPYTSGFGCAFNRSTADR